MRLTRANEVNDNRVGELGAVVVAREERDEHGRDEAGAERAEPERRDEREEDPALGQLVQALG